MFFDFRSRCLRSHTDSHVRTLTPIQCTCAHTRSQVLHTIGRIGTSSVVVCRGGSSEHDDDNVSSLLILLACLFDLCFGSLTCTQHHDGQTVSPFTLRYGVCKGSRSQCTVIPHAGDGKHADVELSSCVGDFRCANAYAMPRWRVKAIVRAYVATPLCTHVDTDSFWFINTPIVSHNNSDSESEPV